MSTQRSQSDAQPTAQNLATPAPDAVIRRLLGMTGPAAHWTGDDGTAFSPTGPVLANWAFKAAGFLEDLDAGADLPLVIVAPGGRLHWRALCFVLAAFALQAPVVFVHVDGAGAAGAAVGRDLLPDTYLALAPEGYEDTWPTADAEEVLVYPDAPLALSVQVDPGFTDAATAVRSYPDQRMLPRVTQCEYTVIDGDQATTHTIDTATPAAEQRGEQGGEQAAAATSSLHTLLSLLGTEEVRLGIITD